MATASEVRETQPISLESAATSERAATPPVRWREIVALLLIVLVADLWIYRRPGSAGFAAFLWVVGILLAVTSPWQPRRVFQTTVAAMALLLVLRLVWLGGPLQVLIGLALLTAFGMATAGRVPYVLDMCTYGVQMLPAGMVALFRWKGLRGPSPNGRPQVVWGAALLPLVALLGFGTIFILANPDLSRFVGERFDWLTSQFSDWLFDALPEPAEICFWGFVLLAAAGMLRPLMTGSVLETLAQWTPPTSTDKPAEAAGYAACRNTLVTVVTLFAVYLVFEFATLWFRDFPEGFYYAGYAHEGAAWLTVALAAACGVLSAIFRGSLLADPRLSQLKRLAWLWSLENLLLALAVYNRLFIYVGFNGMTRMRMIGLFGITAVVVGFLIVVRKIAAGRDFVWLIDRELWTLAVAIFLYVVLPVDLVVHAYNVRRILGGDPAPAVQITEHAVDVSGMLMLPPLLKSDDPIIRDGIAAMLADRSISLNRRLESAKQVGWTRYQMSEHLLADRLRQHRSELDETQMEPAERLAAWRRFKTYAYQWY